MILQSLVRLYERRVAAANADDGAPAPVGFEYKAIPFVIVLNADGALISLNDTRRSDGKKRVAASELVPAGVKKTSGVAANLLWDTAEYVLGLETQLKNKLAKPERIHEQHAAFLARLNELPEGLRADPGVSAVLKFLLAPDTLDRVRALPEWEELRTTNPLMSFRLQNDQESLVCQRLVVRQWWQAQNSADEADGLCLVTGKPAVIERLHPAIKGVWGAQSSGANLVSFNLDAFESYGKQQGANAPIGRDAAAKYTTALNDLLRSAHNRIQVGDASTVYWADEDRHPIETAFAALFGAYKKDDPTRDADYVKNVYESIRTGQLLKNAPDTRFFVLGLAPNAARLSVRFWHMAMVSELSARFAEHIDDMDIVRPPFELAEASLFRLLTACVPQRKADNIPPNLGGDVLRAVLEGRNYPAMLFAAALRRCCAERTVDYPRAAILKAHLNRSKRIQKLGRPELQVSLDPDNDTPAYLLGQLFMILEQIQREAMGDINRTIRDTYWSAAMAEPQRTFPHLIDLSGKHLKKMSRDKPGRVENLRKLVGDRVARLYRKPPTPDSATPPPFPKALASDEQGLFIVGYYHQRQSESTYKSSVSKQP